jgi:ribose-phosphate pyrophosphokinase
MELLTKKKLVLFAGRATEALAAEIAKDLDVELGDAQLINFANGEIHCKFGESIRGADVFILQTHTAFDDSTLNDAIIEQLIMCDAARRASAKRITVVCPYYGYSRQDRKSSGREPITAKLLANLFAAAGVQRLVSLDLHSGQIQGFFDGPVDHLTAAPVLTKYLKEHLKGDLVVVSPDSGRVKVAERYAQHLGAEVATVYKRRDKSKANTVEALDVMGDVDGRVCVIVDDMIDTAGTVCAAADQLVKRGATDVWAAATHGVLSGPAIDRIKNSVISRVVITDTLPLPPEKQIDKIVVLSAAGIIAAAIDAVFEDTSVSEIFNGENQS